MTDTATDQRSGQERRWHLSDALIGATPQPIVVKPEVSEGESKKRAVIVAAEEDPRASPSAPLWVRLLTGKSLAWRLRRGRNRVRRARRGVARRMSRWIRLHPEIRRAAA
ncbi:hypothetical protein, partial [Ilumatobacter sp.]|uniref:hypothetical protein n=1 Tax=Ilumatobacter sp. TaxID=1967498 RepID=UPI003C5B1A85